MFCWTDKLAGGWVSSESIVVTGSTDEGESLGDHLGTVTSLTLEDSRDCNDGRLVCDPGDAAADPEGSIPLWDLFNAS